MILNNTVFNITIVSLHEGKTMPEGAKAVNIWHIWTTKDRIGKTFLLKECLKNVNEFKKSNLQLLLEKFNVTRLLHMMLLHMIHYLQLFP